MKEYLLQFLTNHVLMAAILGWAVAQGSKIIYESIQYGFSTERLSGGGGMPSAHSATVTALTTAALLTYGPGSFAFPIALFFSIIVIYDARNVRYETGREAAALNKLREEQIARGEEPMYAKPLAEKMGHTVPEIIVGIIIGIVCGALICILI